MMISRPVSSTQVRTTFAFTLSPTPRKLTIATTAMKARPISVMPMPPARPRPKACREIGGEGARGGRGRGDARAHHREGDDEGHEMDAEGLVRVERGARSLRIFRDQLEIAEGGHQRDDEGHQERQPDHAADLLGDLAGQRIDAGAENVADDEEQQQPRAHHAMQAGFDRRRGSGCCNVRHQSLRRMRESLDKYACVTAGEVKLPFSRHFGAKAEAAARKGERWPAFRIACAGLSFC